MGEATTASRYLCTPQIKTSLSTHCPDNSSATSAQPDPKKIPGSRFIHSPAFFLFTFIHTY